MPSYVNHVAIAAPRNGTTTHTVTPSSGTVVAGTLFTPTAGRFLVCVAGGGVTSTTPAGWTLPSNGSAVGGQGVYVWYRVAAGGDSLTTTHNAANYPVVFDFYEFEVGTTFRAAAAATNAANTAATPILSGLTGTNWLAGCVSQSNTSASTRSFTWGSGTEQTDTSAIFSATDGYNFSLTSLTDSVLTSVSFAPNGTDTTSSDRLAFAVNTESAAGPPGPAFDPGAFDAAAFYTADGGAAVAATVTDAAAGADALTDVDDRARTVDDTAPATDTLIDLDDRVRTVTDPAAATDALTDVDDRARALADTAGASDALTVDRGQTLTDTASASDALTNVRSATVTLPYTEPFTGADGDAWPAAWTTVNGTGLATIVGNKGRILSPPTTFTTGPTNLLNMPDTADVEILIEGFNSGGTAEQYPTLAVRASGTMGTAVQPSNCYYVTLSPAFAVIETGRVVNNTKTQMNVTSKGAVGNVTLDIRVKLTGALFQVRAWTSGTAEPATWNIWDAVDQFPLLTPGKVMWNGRSGNGVSQTAVIDTFTVSPAVAVSDRVETLTDSAAGTDSLTVQADRSATLTDGAGAADALTSTIARAQTVTDPAAGSDAATAVRAVDRTLTDQAAGADTIAADRTVTLTDPAAATDTLTATAARTADLTDLAAASDAVSTDRAGAQTVELADVGQAADTVTVQAVRSGSLTNQAAGSDALTAARAAAVTDAAAGADAVLVARAVTLTDPASGADAVLTDRATSLADPLTGSDTITVSRAATLTDTATGADTLTVDATRDTALTDAAAGSDSLSVTAAGAQSVSLSEAATGTDAVTSASVRVASLTDQAGAVDVLTADRASTLADPLAGADTTTATADRARQLTDPATATDALTVDRAGVTTAAVSDTAAGSDTLTGVYTRPAALTDAAAAADSLTVERTAGRAVTVVDPMTVLDQIEATWVRAAVLEDQAAAVDTVDLGRAVTLTDFLTATDVLALFAGPTRDLDLTAQLDPGRYTLTLTGGRYTADLDRDRYNVDVHPDRYASDVDRGRYKARAT